MSIYTETVLRLVSTIYNNFKNLESSELQANGSWDFTKYWKSMTAHCFIEIIWMWQTQKLFKQLCLWISRLSFCYLRKQFSHETRKQGSTHLMQMSNMGKMHEWRECFVKGSHLLIVCLIGGARTVSQITKETPFHVLSPLK